MTGMKRQALSPGPGMVDELQVGSDDVAQARG